MTKPLSDVTVTPKTVYRWEQYGDGAEIPKDWNHIGHGVYEYVGPPWNNQAIQRSIEEG